MAMKVLCNSFNMCFRDLPDMYAWNLSAEGIHIKQIPHAHVTMYKYPIFKRFLFLKKLSSENK